MRYLLGAVFLASCTALTPSPTGNASLEQPAPEPAPAATLPLPEGEQETRKPKPKVAPTPAAAEISSCANLNMEDLKETIKAKLDCISENAK
jgi:hypothetical protein